MTPASPRRSALSPFLCAILAWSGWHGLRATFATLPPVQGGPTKKQRHGSIHNRNTLGDVVEVPLEEPAAELPTKPAMPDHRLPYTLHVESNYPHGHHLKDDSKNNIFIKEKITHAFERFEDYINHVEVHLEVNEKRHRDKALTPYVFQIIATLKNRQVIRVNNAEKHARPTLQEALDHTLDVMRLSLKDHKEKKIHQAKKARKNVMLGEDPSEQESLDADALADELAMQQDAADERLYSLTEDDGEMQGRAASTIADAVAKAEHTEESETKTQSQRKPKSQSKHESPSDAPSGLRDVLMAGL